MFFSIQLFAQNQRTEKVETESFEETIEDSKQKWFKIMQKPNADYFKAKRKFEKYVKHKPEGDSRPREFGASWLMSNMFYLDSKGKVQERPQFVNENNKYSRLSILPEVTDTFSGDWTMLGPRKVVHVGAGVGNGGGYAYLTRIDPYNPSRLFAGFVTGGLWVSGNNGLSWHLSDANLPANKYLDLDVCKSNINIIYAISSYGVIKSIDGGLTFSATTFTNQSYLGTAYDLAVSPYDANLVLVRWADKIYKTIDGGNTWHIVKTGLSNFSVWDSNNNGEVIDWDQNSNTVFFTDRSNSSNNVKLYKSTDNGVSFSLLQTFTLPSNANGSVTGWSKICTATNNSSVVYVFIGSGSDAYSHRAAHMYKVNIANGNILLQRINMVDGLDSNYGSQTMLHHGDISMDLNDENKIIHGGYSSSFIMYSIDNGVSFTQATGQVHSDIRCVSMINGKMFVGTDGAGSLSTDGGSTFTLATNTLSNHELWGFGSSSKADILVAGCNHGPLMVKNNGVWETVLGADQGNSDINPLDSTTVYSQGYDTYHVTIKGPRKYLSASQQIDPGGIYSYFNTLTFHPNKYRTLITHHAGGYPSSVSSATLDTWKNSLVRSDDNGLTVKVIYTFNGQLFREKICDSDTNRIYCVVGLSNNKLMKSEDGGKNFTDITPSTSITSSVTNISDIAVSDSNPDEIWVTYSGVQNSCKVLYSNDGGVSYTNLTQSVLSTSPIFKIIYQKSTNGGVYVGNSTGIYYKNKSMLNWEKLGVGLPDMEVRFMFINYFKGKLIIGTSRGAWEHNLYEESVTKAIISVDQSNPNCDNYIVSFKDNSICTNSNSGVQYQWYFPGGNPSFSTLENPKVSYKKGLNGTTYSVTLTVTDKNGSSTQTLNDFIKYTIDSNCCQGVPETWKYIETGSINFKSSVCYTSSNDNYKITCNQSGVSSNYDTIPFVYQILSGDGSIIAKVKDVSNTWNYAGGIMIRNSLAPNSPYVFIGALDSRGLITTFRTTNGGSSGYNVAKTVSLPQWIKISKVGNTITTYFGADTNSFEIYATKTLPNSPYSYIGLTAFNYSCVSNISNPRIKGNSIDLNVTLTSPINDTILTNVNSYILTSSSSTSNGSIDKIEYYSGSVLLGTSTTFPFNYNWNSISEGNYVISAKVYSSLGLISTSSSVNMTVKSNQVPSVVLTSPIINTSFQEPASIDIVATASDADGVISKVEFYNGSVLLGTCYTNPYKFNWTNVSAGKYNITAKAYDNLNATSTSSLIDFTVKAICQSISASSNDGNVPVNVIDNNFSTRWSSQGDGQWIQFCLSDTTLVNHVNIAFYNGNSSVSTFDILYSKDGINWTNAALALKSSGTTLDEETFSFADIYAKFIRIVGHGNNINELNSYTEVNIQSNLTGFESVDSDIFNVYPNPGSGIFNINKEIRVVSVLKPDGSMAKMPPIRNSTFDISDLASGVYFVKLIKGNEEAIVKVMKK